MVDKKHLEISAYIFGIVSIVLAFFEPIAGIILGIIGLFQSKKNNTPLSKKAKKLSIIGIILGLVILVALLGFTIYSLRNGVGTIPAFPN